MHGWQSGGMLPTGMPGYFCRCAIDAECGWFQYLEAKLRNCILVDGATTVNGGGEIFGSTGQNNIYRKGSHYKL